MANVRRQLLGARLLDPISVTIPPLDDGRVLVVADQMRRCPPPNIPDPLVRRQSIPSAQ